MEVTGKLVIVGDCFPVPSNFSKFAKGDLISLFGEKILELFNNSDYRICNLEGALTDSPSLCEKTGPVLIAPTNTIKTFQALGIDCCTLANNHITDAGAKGLRDTISVLDRAGIEHIGAGTREIRHYTFFCVQDYKICLYNVGETMYNAPSDTKPGAFLYDEYIVCNELRALEKECDFLIVVYHGGAEKFRFPTPQMRTRFHRMVDCGANMILAQHTHCVGCEEYYNGAYLLYGQGNFLFRSFNNEFTDTGLIIELVFEHNGYSVNKYLVNAIGDTVRYDLDQDFAKFNERSSKVNDEAYILKEFQEYCLNEVYFYLKAYKGKIPFQKFMNHFAPIRFKNYILRSYHRRQLLFTLHSLRSEQNREVAITGIEELLKTDIYRA